MSLMNDIRSSDWLVEESEADLARLNVFETLLTVGNGFLGTRGALEEGVRGEFAGTFLAGIFDPHDSTVIDIVSVPNWLPLRIWVDGVQLSVQNQKVLEHRRVLDMRTGALYRRTQFEDSDGRRSCYESIRFASFAHQSLCAIRACLTLENHDSDVVVDSSIEGHTYNNDRMPNYLEQPTFDPEIKWEKWAKSKHLDYVSSTSTDDAVYLECRTIDTGHSIGYASTMTITGAECKPGNRLEYGRVGQVHSFQATRGQTYTFDKFVTIHSSRNEPPSPDSSFADVREMKALGFDACFTAQRSSWESKWDDCDSLIEGDDVALHALRFNIYHMLISANENDPAVSIGAKTLSGEGYKGHVFWDTEIFLLPFFVYTQPETAKALLLYRYHTLEGAKQNAAANGFEGAQYAWESADTGVETTPKWTSDGANRIWTGEEEIHITSDVAYAVLIYLAASNDEQFFLDYGAEILFETARFWQSRLDYNDSEDRFELRRVIGPDEFHEHVDNNVFTNYMAKWNLQQAVLRFGWMRERYPDVIRRLQRQMALSEDEIDRWDSSADKVFIPLDQAGQAIEQFEGYFDCRKVAISEWDDNDMPVYPDGIDHFNAGETTLLKQPDVIMLMYVLPDEFDDVEKRTNYAFYEKRTMHKSSLSPSIHSIMGIEVGDTDRALQYFMRSALVDLIDNQGNTEWGIHAASAGGTWMCAVFGFGGFRVKKGQMTFKPWLPPAWHKLHFKLQWRGDTLSVTIFRNHGVFLLTSDKEKTEEILVMGESVTLKSGEEFAAPFTEVTAQ